VPHHREVTPRSNLGSHPPVNRHLSVTVIINLQPAEIGNTAQTYHGNSLTKRLTVKTAHSASNLLLIITNYFQEES
jgi:hypothetical protein